MRASVAAIVLVLLASNGAAQITDFGVYEDWNNQLTGFVYKDGDATPDGITSAVLKAGATGKASLQIKARGPAVTAPTLPFSQQSAVTVQLQHDGGACWTSAYGAPPARNDDAQFKDRF